MRGDPFRVGQIADSLEFKHRLTAGVIARAPEDNPSPEQIDEVLDNFERLARASKVHLAPHEKKIRADAVKSGEPPKVLDIEALTGYLIDHIRMGHINNRADIKTVLESL